MRRTMYTETPILLSVAWLHQLPYKATVSKEEGVSWALAEI